MTMSLLCSLCATNFSISKPFHVIPFYHPCQHRFRSSDFHLRNFMASTLRPPRQGYHDANPTLSLNFRRSLRRSCSPFLM
jgi:hypothetical protein